ncbi:hypothetical protein LTR99_011117 [Exophiala xenobiotica]|uniref:Peptidase A1 domain-containing protein n=1 Tax=Vermiconidia calcicola TaxID=1690605 RepID=A0AAV9PT81_9PEZI|nr:hypothetical protein LTR99_011117 [Exophiala xenobiotica]KAK5425381.1 hypothetical protein LTR34_011167 [Exophiala xenobiotica]KAK5527529.1 hypothetical protein LTR25_011110 [Vermiconidia calcicola]KAK5528544.1 hypothetical protein LTR23_010983 [Chaetothyriales sp. CCFEE 6169]
MSSCPNGAAPMFLEWGNTSVTIDQTLARGIEIGIGTPQQIVALTPSSNDNDLYVVNKQACQPSYNDSCAGLFGGLFNPTASTSYVEVTQAQWNGTAEPNPNHLSHIYFNDDISFGNTIVDGFPAFMDQLGYGNQGSLPLGWNSTFLNAVVAQNATPSRYWSLWPGSRSIDYGVPGELVVGGIDETRFNPQNVATFQSVPECTLCAIVTG